MVIFVPDGFYFYASYVHVWCAPTFGSYFLEHGDVPRCPNLLRKNASTSQRATAPYFWNFCKIWVSRNVFMFRKVRSKCRRTLYVHITGTKIELNHQAEKSPFQLYFTDVSSELKNSKNRDFFKNFIFVKKLKRFGSNSSWLFFSLPLIFCKSCIEWCYISKRSL